MLKKFWLGETPMWINYWILGILVFRILLYNVLIYILDVLGLATEFYINFAMIFLFPLYIFWSIGTWRSAQIYKGRKLWSSLTELGVIINMGVGTYLFYFACVYFF